MQRWLLFLPVLAASPGLSAQPLTCTTMNVDPVVRSTEAVAVLVSNIVIQCRGGTPTPAGQAIPPVDLQVTFNTSVTSRLLARSPDLSEALLLIGEPAPHNQLPCLTRPCSIQATGGASNPYDGSPGHYNVFQAGQIASNALQWSAVPFDPPGSGNSRTLRIANVRVNMYTLAHSNCLSFGCNSAVVGLLQSPDLHIENPQLTVAYLQELLRFRTTTTVFPPSAPHLPDFPTPDLKITFTEARTGTFRPRTVAAEPSDVSDAADQNILGTSYDSTTGFYNASFAGTYAGAGLATQGTRLVARFENVPPDVGLFVSAQPIVSTFPLTVQLVSTGPNAEGPYNPIPADPNGYAWIPVTQGRALAVWEVISATPAIRQSAQFGVMISYPSSGANPTLHTGTATVRGSLGPFTTVFNASLNDPAPRYVEGPAQFAFRIGNRPSPNVTSVVNGADFAHDAPVSPGGIAAIFGTDFVSEPAVRMNGLTAPVLAATPTELTVQIPWELAGTDEARLTVTAGQTESDPIAIRLADTAPHISMASTGPDNIVTIFGTGFGPVRNPPPSGTPAAGLFSTTWNSPAVTIGGLPADVTYSGLAPGMTGVWQINAVLPGGVARGSTVPLQVVIGGRQTPPVALIVSLP